MDYGYKKLKEEKNLRGKRVLLRLDLNVPIDGGEIRDTFRIDRIMPTLQFLAKAGAKTVVVSHLDPESGTTLEPVSAFLSHPLPVSFVKNIEEAESRISATAEGSFVLMENIRAYKEEEENNEIFAKRLAALGDIFVNDAFSVSHRGHASIIGVPKFLPSFAGFLFDEEVEHLSAAFHPPHPFLFILGGAKFETKLPLVRKFLNIADTVFICGALANDFFKLRGYEVGKSKISSVSGDLSQIASNPKLKLPFDVLVKNSGGVFNRLPSEVGKDEKIVDAGGEALKIISEEVEKARFILWNGPLGEYEGGFSKATEKLAVKVADSVKESVIGGGDTLASVSALHLLHHFSFVSTGGGAMLQFLADETLPGIEALKKSRNG